MTKTLQSHRGDHSTPDLNNATVADAMSPGIITCGPETAIEAVAELMARLSVHAVAVGGISSNHLVWGVIDSLDLVRALTASPPPADASAIVRQPALSIEPEATLREAALLMVEHEVAHLIVVSGERPIGVVSTLDIAAAAADARK